MLANNDRLKFHIESDMREPIVVGKGNWLYLSGWCYHLDQPIQLLEVILGEKAHTVEHHSIPEPEAIRSEGAYSALATLSGFFTLIPLAPITEPQTLPLTLRAKLANGESLSATLPPVSLIPAYPLAPTREVVPEGHESEPLIAIGMASYNPPLDLFAKQIASISNQTHQRWCCVVNDDGSPPEVIEQMRVILARDARFSLMINPQRLGFYANFERTISLLPPNADFIALSDQDDEWYPTKLAESLAAFTPETTLVYTDMDIVSPTDEILYHTFWVGRKNNFSSLEALLMTNTVTGAASVFRRELLDAILPFPPRIGKSFHDHWIASVALAQGKIRFINKPLYAYKQHESNVIGHSIAQTHALLPPLTKIARNLRSPGKLREGIFEYFWESRFIYRNDLTRLAMVAQTLDWRLPSAPRAKKRILRRYARFDRSIATVWREGVTYMITRRPSLGAEWLLLRSAVGFRSLESPLGRKLYAIYLRRKLQEQQAAVSPPVA